MLFILTIIYSIIYYVYIMKTWYWIVIGVIALGIIWWVYASTKTPTEQIQQTAEQTISTSTQATTTVSTTTVATSTATSSKPKSVPKQITPAPVWTEFLKAFHCFKVSPSATTKVNSFRQEGMPVAVGSQQAYQCSNGHTWVY